MSSDKAQKISSARHKGREAALQMLYAVDLTKVDPDNLIEDYWKEVGEAETDDRTREFAEELVHGTLRELTTIDDRIRTRAEHWRIERMATVDRNILRLAVFEFLFNDTPDTVVINEALEITRRFSTYEAMQFINGILDAIKHDLQTAKNSPDQAEKSQASSI
jgi:N utilization substance protein B